MKYVIGHETTDCLLKPISIFLDFLRYFLMKFLYFPILRVGVWEAAKWVAKMRDTACSSCSSAVILRTNINGGHFQEGGRFTHCWETAYEYAYLMKVVGATEE
ncbi:Oligopeptidase B [Handroanthus impetiginosus]|uniref:Oligopeptidase B n=1 Tax=Handroanthus impetiginosus TaxID=429701 RepID=A0A2G9H5P6_9LAMI|nr:Oligopeptidase B [Handroanthus impetiginosus]